ncbi:MAG: thioredoxin-disulfide reductase [Spirochaetes bacterium GWD1_27_9]|nr:MAG: thioredoxin-disulfide reductase [Spirochaetes bacterium GWB1_27_13]OHD23632.1 MAG: thioredoxin-disulfide reductase [Spirochaetes bacterium GWC1_27_15]OHD39261.1 MAG: thioredoxin-disulfide reductase [Spirochaetes bacterium GWD1_27_9]
MINEINANDYENTIVNQKGLAILDFYSTECPPCEALHPKYEFFDDIYKDNIKFYKIFRQGNKELATKLGVKSSPTLLFYKDGKEIAPRLTGAIKKSEINKTIVEYFKLEDKTKNIKRVNYEYDLVIIGGGPAGLTAGLYAGRAKIKTLIIDQNLPGGQVNLTHMVANYPGTGEDINGYALMHKLTEQVKRNDVDFFSASEIRSLDLTNKTVEVDDDKFVKAKAMILATGAKPRELGLPGEKEFFGKGISYCATCDGRFYEGKNIAVIGGGNSAVEESLFLAEFVNKITIIHQFDQFQANKTASDEALNNPKINVLWSHEPRAFVGTDRFEKLEVEDLKTKEKKVVDNIEGIFVFVGYVPQTELFKDQLKFDKWGYVEADETLKTNIPGVFVAGDVRSKQFRQITTAVSDGTVAALSVQKYLRG